MNNQPNKKEHTTKCVAIHNFSYELDGDLLTASPGQVFDCPTRSVERQVKAGAIIVEVDGVPVDRARVVVSAADRKSANRAPKPHRDEVLELGAGDEEKPGTGTAKSPQDNGGGGSDDGGADGGGGETPAELTPVQKAWNDYIAEGGDPENGVKFIHIEGNGDFYDEWRTGDNAQGDPNAFVADLAAQAAEAAKSADAGGGNG
ncbi:MAG: hypothetical protein K8953_05555 [Proteobacteria bacterium]|nr:hypothetical protein [Pseudomonadota bacterium]